MSTNDETTIVVFRKWPNGDILALFPQEEGRGGCCLSYEHFGQGGSANYSLCIRATKPATEAESAELLKELESLDYKLDIRQRAPRWSA